MEKYDVVFRCYVADYYWEVEKDLTLEEAEKIVLNKNKDRKIHDFGCCQYFFQKVYENQ